MEEGTKMCWIMEELMEEIPEVNDCIRPSRADSRKVTKKKSFQHNLSTVEDNPDPYKLCDNYWLDIWGSNLHIFTPPIV